jgi:hypothetical protein
MSEQVKQWRPFNDSCCHCGGDSEVLTDTGRDNSAYDGDKARCIDCGCPGVVIIGNEDEDSSDNGIDWHDEAKCDCDWCKAHPATWPTAD